MEKTGKAARIVRPRLTALEAECLYCTVSYFDEPRDCELVEWLGGSHRVQAAQDGATKLRRAVYGPPQRDDEELVEARYQARQERAAKKAVRDAQKAVKGLSPAERWDLMEKAVGDE